VARPLSAEINGDMARTEFLQIRLSPDDRKRIERAARADHLDLSTWARRAILLAVDLYERERANTIVEAVTLLDQGVETDERDS
jgi:uncharacterized protein (DUF1778 family)